MTETVRKPLQPLPVESLPPSNPNGRFNPEPPIKSKQLWEVLGFSVLGAAGGKAVYKSNDAAAIGAIIGGLVTYYWTSNLQSQLQNVMPEAPPPPEPVDINLNAQPNYNVSPPAPYNNVRKPPNHHGPVPYPDFDELKK